MYSIWERNSFFNYNHIVVGGGIVGLSTAYYLKKRYPGQSVLVLERGILPSGASTKNAGFACMGSPSELLDDLLHSTEDEVMELFLWRKKGLERLRSLLGDTEIGYQTNGSYELLFAKDMHLIEQLDYLNRFLYKELTTEAFGLAHHKIKNFRFNDNQITGMIENKCEGEIDTGKMMKKLIEICIHSGVEMKTGCEVMSFSDQGNSVAVHCKNNQFIEDIRFKCDTLSICNNAFARQLLPGYDVVPGRGQVFITKPIHNLSFKGIFHFEKGYYYFREYAGRVLFGGGRNLDFEKEKTTLFQLNNEIQSHLEGILQNTILPENIFEVDLRWAGIMAFGEAKRPVIRQESKNVFVGVRMGGMGIAIGAEVGYQLANNLH